MQMSFTPQLTESVLSALRTANSAFLKMYPGVSEARQPVHTVYGGAQIFKSDTAEKLGATALRALEENAPTFVDFAIALEFPGFEKLPRSLNHIASLRR